jgi:hypothetical protein
MLFYTQNIHNNDIFMVWVLFYSGLLVFCLSLFFIKKLEFICIYAILTFIVGILISALYIGTTVANFKRNGVIMEYYYLPPVTIVAGTSMLFVCMYTTPYMDTDD